LLKKLRYRVSSDLQWSMASYMLDNCAVDKNRQRIIFPDGTTIPVHPFDASTTTPLRHTHGAGEQLK
jgi:hypothetical protein